MSDTVLCNSIKVIYKMRSSAEALLYQSQIWKNKSIVKISVEIDTKLIISDFY